MLLLSSSFLFSTFEKHKVYEQLPNALASSLPNDPNLSEEEGARENIQIPLLSYRNPEMEKRAQFVLGLLAGSLFLIILGIVLRIRK